MAPRKKSPDSRFAGLVRPNMTLTEDENWSVERARADLRMEKGEFLKACVLYVIRHGLDPRK
jgi:hypothetical protein